MPGTQYGIDIDQLFNSCCNLLYVMPSHQFPTGRTIPVSNRLRLLEWAIKNDAYIIENDYDSEFPHQTRPIPSLQSLDHYDHVIYFNTFAKILTPSMRTAFSFSHTPFWISMSRCTAILILLYHLLIRLPYPILLLLEILNDTFANL